MNSDERRAARRKRREEKRAEKRRERIEGCTLERVADLNSLYDAACKAKRGVEGVSPEVPDEGPSEHREGS